MKVVLAGALGYIGSWIIEYYKKNPVEEVILIDKRFKSECLANLPEYFQFYEKDLYEIEEVKPLFKNADILYLLAAEVEAEKSINKEEKVWRNSYEVALRVIKSCDDATRIMFCSSGNVFGGVNEKEKYMNLAEEDEPKPRFPYAESKVAVEKFLLESGKNFTICRFGTNFGYAPGIRFNLVTNLFIKKAIQGENLTVHGYGENYRPSVHVQDAAEGMIFLASKTETSGDIYHVVKHNFKIKDLAIKIAAFNHKVKVNYSEKKVPFSSYHLSNEKIINAGYKFKWDIDSGIKNMMDIYGSVRKIN